MTDNDNLPARKPLTPEQMHALVKPAEDLAAQLFTNAGTEAGIKTAFDAFLSTGLMKVLKDDVVGKQVMQWAEDHGIDLPEAPEADAAATKANDQASGAAGDVAGQRKPGSENEKTSRT